MEISTCFSSLFHRVSTLPVKPRNLSGDDEGDDILPISTLLEMKHVEVGNLFTSTSLDDFVLNLCILTLLLRKRKGLQVS